MAETRILKIESEYIELYQALKYEALTSSGGEAKFVISEGLVEVDGEVETRKRKKITPGSVIQYDGATLKIETK
ncbi:MAG: RNA-binding S4 domain-containing protein [Verrucomicrobiota bacterium]